MSARGKQGDDAAYEFGYMRKPDDRTKRQVIRDWIYDPRKGTVLGRTAKQWGIVGLFYLTFYSALAALCAICFCGLMATIDPKRPTYTLSRSLIGTNPGLGFRPISNDTSERSLIWYDAKNATQINKWTALLDDFLIGYWNKSALAKGGRTQMPCDYNQLPHGGKVCDVDFTKYGDCRPGTDYGYSSSQPCVFIKLNRIFDWIPDYYNDTEDLPQEMPEDLKTHIKTLRNQPEKLNTVWVSCKGEDPRARETIRKPKDKDHPVPATDKITGDLLYYPETRGFPGYYFPYTHQLEYVSPIVAVQFVRPEGSEVIRVECRAWAKNIHYRSKKGEKNGAIHFELMVD
ncbi:sodium/potassium-transporting ATPase subunit beta-2-like [Phymastichus coffea]|uniref:sodium/potassium-transporting ATPase subunit beta-2-like n=1 Tax=Phymastichus coffea TaxID=108790 RepID=UPI00273C9302|nr:sodium/potassium-transporting ATPase subunit beta-2-like [Phymastichus coffea]